MEKIFHLLTYSPNATAQSQESGPQVWASCVGDRGEHHLLSLPPSPQGVQQQEAGDWKQRH